MEGVVGSQKSQKLVNVGDLLWVRHIFIMINLENLVQISNFTQPFADSLLAILYLGKLQ